MQKITVNTFFLFVVFLHSIKCYGQDIQFSQYYAVPFYQNPAYVGSRHAARGVFHQRVQWPGLDARYLTSMAAFDTYFSKYNSSVGLVAIQDYQGPSTITTTDLHLMYAYELHISQQVTFRPALQIGMVRRKVDYSELTLPEQFTNQGPTGAPVQQGSLGANSRLYPEVAAGGLFYTPRGWIGIGITHLNQANQSFYNQIARLPTKFSVTGGHKFYVKKEKFFAYMETEKEFTISPTFNYRFQGKSDQLDLGLYLVWDQIQGGLWYRGIPVKKYSKQLPNNESIVPMIGYRINNFTFSYSYDFTMSRLTVAKTYGAHEFNITYVNNVTKRKKPKILKRLPCPKF